MVLELNQSNSGHSQSLGNFQFKFYVDLHLLSHSSFFLSSDSLGLHPALPLVVSQEVYS